jgi:mannose-1-phosphate guanylyltransferase
MPQNWPALVLAAGLGTRLAPLSTVRAKAALPVAGRPLIVRILGQLYAAGVRRVVVNLHHRAETIARVVGDGTQFGMEVRYSWETQVLGSGGGPARALPLLAADRFFIVNGDTLSDFDVAGLRDAHIRSRAEVTLAVAAADLGKYGALLGDSEGCLTGVVPRGTAAAALAPKTRPWHFVGVQAVNSSAFAMIDPSRPSEVFREIYPSLVRRAPASVRVFPITGAFHDIGTPADYLHTVQRLARAEARPLDCGLDTQVGPGAQIEGTVLWDRVRIGKGARLTNCVIADDVVIPPGVHYDRMAITRETITPF